MIRIFLITLVVFISGCATTSLTPEPISIAKLNDKTGIVFGTFSRDTKTSKYYSQTFYFRNVQTGQKYRIHSQPEFNIFSGKTPDDFNTGDSHGALFAFTLPAGKYTFDNFNLYRSTGYSYQYWSSKTPYSIPFEVVGNKIKYLGEIKLVAMTGKNLFGIRVPAGGVWVITDQQKRDFPLIKNKHPEVAIDQVIISVPDREEVATPLVILPSEQKKKDKGI